MRMKNRDRTLPLPEVQYEVQFVNEGFGPVEGDEPFRATVGFISLESTQAAVHEAMGFYRKIKFAAAAFYLKGLWPFPVQAIEAFAGRVDKIVVIEETQTASLSKRIREMTGLHPVTMVPPSGRSIRAEDIYEKEDWN
jgi:TPP-dependent indolepyruvate ferredoxin oxidoreductase alpha subunit